MGLMQQHIMEGPQFDYVSKGNPTIDVNPRKQYATWMNITTGELFVCTKNTIDANSWRGSYKTIIMAYSLPKYSVVTSFPSPSTFPYGLTFDGTNLISCDSGSDRIYVHDGVSSTILTSFPSPSSYPSGLTFDGTNLISCDLGSDRIYVHDGVSQNILTSFSTPSSSPRGLTFDGTNLISCDSGSDKIYVHDGVSSSILTSFSSPSSNPSGLAFDGTNLISCDSASDKIYVHAREDGQVVPYWRSYISTVG